MVRQRPSHAMRLLVLWVEHNEVLVRAEANEVSARVATARKVQVDALHFANPLCLTIDIDVEHEYFLQEECHWSSAVGRLWVSYVQQTFNEDDVSRAPGSSKRQEYLGFGLRCGCVR